MKWSRDPRRLCDTLVVRYKPGIWPLTALIAVLCGLSIWAVVAFRSRPMAPAELMRRLPTRDALVAYIDFAALRRDGILQMLDKSKVAEDAEYQEFVRETEFDYKQDLDSVLIAFTPMGKFLLASGRFDWKSLRSYVSAQQGQCYNSFCKLNGSTPDRHISFFPLQANLMAMAVSPDDSAALRLQGVAPGPAPEVPPAPVWKEKPSLSRPEASITSAAYLAMSRPAGSRVSRVVVETILAGSPRDSIRTT